MKLGLSGTNKTSRKYSLLMGFCGYLYCIIVLECGEHARRYLPRYHYRFVFWGAAVTNRSGLATDLWSSSPPTPFLLKSSLLFNSHDNSKCPRKVSLSAYYLTAPLMPSRSRPVAEAEDAETRNPQRERVTEAGEASESEERKLSVHLSRMRGRRRRSRRRVRRRRRY